MQDTRMQRYRRGQVPSTAKGMALSWCFMLVTPLPAPAATDRLIKKQTPATSGRLAWLACVEAWVTCGLPRTTGAICQQLLACARLCSAHAATWIVQGLPCLLAQAQSGTSRILLQPRLNLQKKVVKAT